MNVNYFSKKLQEINKKLYVWVYYCLHGGGGERYTMYRINTWSDRVKFKLVSRQYQIQEAHGPQRSPELTAVSWSGHLLSIPCQPVKFQGNGVNSFWDI